MPPPPARNHFALTGRSIALDPTRYAVRKDLADVDLADRVFAPHYAKALETQVIVDQATIRSSPAADSEPVGTIDKGERFRVLEITDRHVWGQAGSDGPVGYVDRDAISEALS